jgi:hypothetical protein
VKSPFPSAVCWPTTPVCTVTVVVCYGAHGVRNRTSAVCTLPASLCNRADGMVGLACVVCSITQVLDRFSQGYCGPTNIVRGPANIVCGPVWPLFSPHFLTCRRHVAVLLAARLVEHVDARIDKLHSVLRSGTGSTVSEHLVHGQSEVDRDAKRQGQPRGIPSLLQQDDHLTGAPDPGGQLLRVISSCSKPLRGVLRPAATNMLSLLAERSNRIDAQRSASRQVTRSERRES